MTMVAPRRPSTSVVTPRSAERSVTITNPATTARTAPTRLISREPARAAMAKRKTGSPVRSPICVPDKWNSSRSAGMTGGTARIGKRSALPTSHNRISEVGSDRDSATWFFPDLAEEWVRSRRPFEAIERFGKLGAARLRVLALLAFAFDDVFGRAFEEISIAEFLVDARDVGVAFRHFLGQPRALGGEIDHAFQRQRRNLAPHHELHGALGGCVGEGDVSNPRQPLHELRPPGGAFARFG